MKLKVILNALEGILQFVNNFSIRADGNTPITDPVQLISGANISMLQVGNTIEISATNTPPVLTGYLDQEEYLATAAQVNFPLIATPLNGSQVFVSVRGQFLPNDPSFYTYNVGTNSVDIAGGVVLNSVVAFYIATGLNGVTFALETAVGSGPNYTLAGIPIDPASVCAVIDGGFVPKSDFSFDQSDNEVQFNIGAAPTPAQNVSFFYQDGGTALKVSQEKLKGLSNNSNLVFGPMRFDANEPTSILVLKNGRRVPNNQYTMMGKNVVFNAGFEPNFSQSISVVYFYVYASSEQTEYITLTQDQVDAKQLQLEFTPKNPTEVLFDTKSNSFMIYGDDFEIEGNVVKWTGLGLETLAVDGSQLRFHYHI